MTEKHKSQRSESKLTCEVRIAYPFFHEKRTKRADGTPLEKPRHDGVVLVPKLHGDPAQCPNYKMLADHCMEAATKAWGSWPQGGKWPIQDGDIPHTPKAPLPGAAAKAVDPNRNAWRKGCWVVEVSYNLEPGPRVALLQNGQAVEIPARTIAGQTLYKSGDYGIVSLHAYTYQNKTFGVNFGFEGVLFTRAGEAIGSSGPRSAAQMFGAVAGMAPAPAQPSAAPPLPGAPPLAPAAPGPAATYAAPPLSAAAPAYAPPPSHAAPPLPGAPPAYAPPPAPSAPGLPPFPGR